MQAKVINFPADRIAKGVHGYTPEMGDRKPNCQMEASLSHYGRHYFVDTPLDLKGRGIEHLNTYAEKDFVKPGNRKIGWHQYKVTTRAFEALQAQYSIGYEMLLD